MDLKTLYAATLDWWQNLDPETRSQELERFARRFAYNSARIEDDAVTLPLTKEIFKTSGVTGYSGPLAPLYEIQNQKDCWVRLMADVDSRRAFDEGLVLEAHETLTFGTYSPTQLADGERPGTYKQGDYLIAGAPEVGASAEDAPQLVRDLCDEVASALPGLTRGKALIVAAYFHCSFEAIHPFSDGSGLTGRELMNYILLAGGHPPVVIYDEDRRAYFDCLEAFTSDGDLQPFKRFLMAETLRTWRESIGG
ncbi:MAG: Fic family protein [Atopobiaceae bacterium]|jgi:Fic family protein